MKKALSLFLVVLMLVGMLPLSATHTHAAEVTNVEMSILGTTGVLASDKLSISWTSNNVTFTNKKTTSSTAIRNSDSAHYRVYANSEVEISAPGNITKIVITSAGSSYYTPWVNSAGTIGTATLNGSEITVVPTTPATTVKFSATAQVRLSKVEVYYEVAGGATGCEHANTTDVEAVEASCEAPGYTAGVYCSDCESYIDGHTVVAATGHSYGDWVDTTAATCTEAGEQTATCGSCGATKTQTVAALGHNYVGNTCDRCGNVAVITQYELVTNAASLKAGDKIIFVGANADAYYVMIPYDKGNNLKSETIAAPADGKISLPDSSTAAILTLGGDSTGWTLFDGTKYIYSAGGTSDNHLKAVAELPADNTGVWTIVIDAASGEATITNVGNVGDGARNVIKFNYGNAANLFSNYKIDYVSNVGLVSVYREVTGEPENPGCTHANTTTTTVDPTCKDEGTATTVCNDCGEEIKVETLAKTNEHTFVDGACSVCGMSQQDWEGPTDTPDPTVAEGGYKLATFISVGDQVIMVVEEESLVKELSGISTTSTKYGLGTDYTGVPAGLYVLTVCEGNSTGTFAFKNADGSYLCWTSGNSLNVNATLNANASWTVNIDETTNYATVQNAADSSRQIWWNAQSPRFACYTGKTLTTTGYNGIKFYKYVSADACEHTWGEWIETTAPSCTENGVNTATCTLCGETKTESVAAIGHTYTFSNGQLVCACGDKQDVTITDIATVKGYSGNNNTYYIKGIVTYVNGKDVYMEDATGGILVYGAVAFDDIKVGDELLVWDSITTYQGKVETSNTTADEYMIVSSGNALPATTVTIDQVTADTYGKRVVIENVVMGVMGTNNTALTDANGNTINIYKLAKLPENINEGDTVTVTAIVSAYNTTLQLLVNPDTAAADVEEIKDGAVEEIATVTIAEAKAGTAGEYYQVEGTVTYISGRNVYIQDATGGIVVYLTANAATTQVGDTVKAYGAMKVYNGLIELDAVNEADSKFYSILSSGNTVEAQAVTIEGLKADTTNEYLAEKVTLENLYISHFSYSSSYGNVDYTLVDGNGNEIKISRVTVASEEACIAAGSIVNVEAVVSSYNGYQLVTTNDKITVIGTCAHETTELVNAKEATCTEAGYTGDTECVVCGYWTVRGEEIAALGHTEVVDAAVAATCTTAGKTEGKHCSVCNEVIVAQEEIEALGHTEAEKEVEPSCTEQGYTHLYCSVCGETLGTENFVDALGHSYATETTPADCENDGKTVYTCSVCGDSYEEVIPAGHTIEYVAAVIPANCQETGHDEYWHCTACDAYFGDAEASYQVNPAWISYTGEHVRPEDAIICAVVPCELCGEDSYGEPCDRGDAPVCQDAPCVNCGETVYGWGCNYNTGDEEVPKPLCQPGTCVYCGTYYEKLYDCENGSWAPCVDGECAYGCGKQYPATGVHELENPCEGGMCSMCWENIEGAHSYESVVTPPTATEQGYTTHTCTVCGDSYVDSYTDPVPPAAPEVELKWNGANLVLEADLTVNFWIKEAVYNQYENIRVEFVMGDRKAETTEFIRDESGRYGFSFKGVAPYQIKEKIVATVYGTYNGVEYQRALRPYSAYDYLTSASVIGSDIASLRTLAVDLLNYGTIHQEYNSITEDLINAELTDEQKAYGTAGEPVLENLLNTKHVELEGATVKFKGASLELNNAVWVYVNIECEDLTGVTVEVSVDEGDPFVIDAREFVPVADKVNRYSVYFKGLQATQFRSSIDFTVYKDGTAISNTLRYSVESYAYAWQDIGGSLEQLVKAIVVYGDSAKRYAYGE